MENNVLLPLGNPFDFWEETVEYDTELHVSALNPAADDANDGSAEHPLKTIQAAADRAMPGTRVVIHEGVYRECVRPRRGGTDARHMICYEAATGETPIIKASEIVTELRPSVGWNRGGLNGEAREARDDDRDAPIWELRLKPELFKGYNPFNAINLIHDRLFIEYAKTDMTTYLNRRGMVFCDGKPLHQVPLYNSLCTPEGRRCVASAGHDAFTVEGSYWVEANGQTVHIRLPNDDSPDKHVIEVTSREQCFAPEVPFLSYIKLKGLTCAHAATGAPVPQRGAVSAYRGHHWVIEDCTIDWCNTLGIDVGNECWHHTIEPGQQIGYSVIRRCAIRDAGVCGIAGLYATHMLIEDNIITGTGWQKMELSWEAGAIKLHDTVDSLFRRNVFQNTFRADHIWLDCCNENTRITQNLFLDGIEQREAIFIECSRDQINLIDHNIFWNIEGRFKPSDVPDEPGSSGWYKMTELDAVNGYGIYGEGTDHLRIVGNLIGKCRSAGYFSKPVSFRMEGVDRGGTSRDACLAGNIFCECGEAAIKFPTRDNDSDANVFVKERGGYLRVMYPAPPSNLHLPAWQEFFGFDLHGQEAWFDVDVNTSDYTVTFSHGRPDVAGRPWMLEKHNFVLDPDALPKVDMSVLTDTTGLDEAVLRNRDFFGEEITGETVCVGPFAELRSGRVYRIDPRRF